MSEFVKDTAKESGVSQELLKQVIETMGAVLTAGENIILAGFGTFKVKTRKARTGRNPRTGKPVEIAEKKVVSFKAAKQLKAEVNE